MKAASALDAERPTAYSLLLPRLSLPSFYNPIAPLAPFICSLHVLPSLVSSARSARTARPALPTWLLSSRSPTMVGEPHGLQGQLLTVPGGRAHAHVQGGRGAAADPRRGSGQPPLPHPAGRGRADLAHAAQGRQGGGGRHARVPRGHRRVQPVRRPHRHCRWARGRGEDL